MRARVPAERRADPRDAPAAAAPAFQPVRLPPEPVPRPPLERTLHPATRWLVPIGLFLAAFLLLYANVGHPPSVVFDEAHYVRFGRLLADGELLADRGNLSDLPQNPEHPPLGKLLIAASLRAHDAGQRDLTWHEYHKGCDDEAADCPAGRTWEGCDHDNEACAAEARAWRLPSVLAGALGVVGTYWIAARLFHSVTAGLLGAGLLLADTLWYLMSRMALLDVVAAGLAIAALGAALGPTRTHRVASALLMGAAMGSKYPAVFLLPVFLLLHWVRAPTTRPRMRLAWTLAIGLALPLAAFIATYAPFVPAWNQLGGAGYAFDRFRVTQAYALTQDFGFEFDHPYSSPPWTWIPHLHPTFYYWPAHPDYTPPLMYAVGNLALWWPAALAALVTPVVLLVRWLRTTAPLYATFDFFQALPHIPWRLNATRALTLTLLIAWTAYLPWFVLQRTQFNYYATLNVPTFAVLTGGLLHLALRHGPRLRIVAAAYLALVGAFYALAWPIASGAPAPEPLWRAGWTLYPTDAWDP